MKRIKQPQTNTEFLSDIMEFSPHGALMQVLILNLLQKASKELAETPVQEIRDAFGENHFISPDAWHGAAVDLHKSLSERYGK